MPCSAGRKKRVSHIIGTETHAIIIIRMPVKISPEYPVVDIVVGIHDTFALRNLVLHPVDISVVMLHAGEESCVGRRKFSRHSGIKALVKSGLHQEVAPVHIISVILE